MHHALWLKHMLLFKSYFITNLGFQFYLGLYVNYKVMSGALLGCSCISQGFLLNLLYFKEERNYKQSQQQHNNTTKTHSAV